MGWEVKLTRRERPFRIDLTLEARPRSRTAPEAQEWPVKVVKNCSSGLGNRLETRKGLLALGGGRREAGGECEGALGREAWAPLQLLTITAGGLERPFPRC